MAGKKSEDGCATGVGGVLVGLFVLVSMIPKEVWVGLGVAVALAVGGWLAYKAFGAAEREIAAKEQRDRARRAAEAAAAKQQREEAVRQAKQHLIGKIGERNALLVQSAQNSAQQVSSSEAARAGWLGDVDFTADIQGIAENFRKAHALRKVADDLSALANPSADDRKILGEANATAQGLEKAANERVRLIGKCATEAKRVDESLDNERKEARTAEQRAQLHATLSAMLYGIESVPTTMAADSTADAVMARVQAFREIKNQIQRIGNE